MRGIYLSFIATGLAVMLSYGSTVMIVGSSNGSRDVYQLSDVQKMTFVSTSVGLRTKADIGAVNRFSVVRSSLRLFLVENTKVSAMLISVSGRVTRRFPEKEYSRGAYLLSLDKNGLLPGGAYILQVTFAGKVFNHKMIVSR